MIFAGKICKTYLYNIFNFIFYYLRETTGIEILMTYDINITESLNKAKYIKNWANHFYLLPHCYS